jgi:predicted aspartyl protease
VPSITGTVLSHGILIEVLIGVSHPLEQALLRAGLEVPVQQHATFVVDTGADRTTIDDHLVRRLRLEPVTQTRVVTFNSGHAGQLADTYAASVQIKNATEAPWSDRTIRVLGGNLPHGLEGIVGRDVLDRLHLEYNGPIRRFCIRY